jgi:hypothetical protein
MNVVTVKYRNDKTFLVIEVREFEETPFVCRKDGPPKSDLRRGALYIRPPGVAQTTEIRTAEDLQDLLTLAAEKRAQRMIEMAQRIGLTTPSATRPFDDELEGL